MPRKAEASARIPEYIRLAAVYDALISEQITHEWRNGICLLLKQNGITTGAVLDIGSGTGVGARALSELGAFAIDGIDSSPNMVSCACLDLYRTVKCGQFPNDLMESDHYDLVCCGADTFNYVHPPQRAKFISSVHNSLHENGYFALDVISRRLDTPETCSDSAAFVEIQYQTGSQVITQFIRCRRRSCTSSFVFQTNTEAELRYEIHVQYYCTQRTLERLMRSCGFSLQASVPLCCPKGIPLKKFASLWKRN